MICMNVNHAVSFVLETYIVDQESRKGLRIMENTRNVILDFTHVYPEDIETQVPGIKRIDLSDIEGTDMYCTRAAETEIRKRLKPFGPQGIHFLDSGNYHYVTKIFAEKIRFPFSLVLFDYHNDMQQPAIHNLSSYEDQGGHQPDSHISTSCGSWAGDMLRFNPYLKQLILIGPDQKSIDQIEPELKEKLVCVSIQDVEAGQEREDFIKIKKELPAYISIDKDVLSRYEARTNWNQGSMSMEVLEQLLAEVFRHQKVIGVDICGECNVYEPVMQMVEDSKINKTANEILYHFISSYYPYREDEEQVIMRQYKEETGLWDSVYAESTSVDLRDEVLAVEPAFDACLKKFAESTKRVMDFGCGSGDMLFQYCQYQPQNHGVGVDASKEGILSARKTAKMSGYRNLHFYEGDVNFTDIFENGEFDGIILSNVLDVMPENVCWDTFSKLNRVLKTGGFWLIKLNPYYTQEELKSFGYEEIEPHVYSEKCGDKKVLRLRQETTEYWTACLKNFGRVENYIEFQYPWQPGLNRLFVLRKNG